MLCYEGYTTLLMIRETRAVCCCSYGLSINQMLLRRVLQSDLELKLVGQGVCLRRVTYPRVTCYGGSSGQGCVPLPNAGTGNFDDTL